MSNPKYNLCNEYMTFYQVGQDTDAMTVYCNLQKGHKGQHENSDFEAVVTYGRKREEGIRVRWTRTV